MRKSDKKKETTIIKALTQACEIAKDRGDGFEWLTHFVDYSRFPDSLEVVCIYNTNQQLACADRDAIGVLIEEKLADIDVRFGDIRHHVSFDTEENCERDNNGDWNKRL